MGKYRRNVEIEGAGRRRRGWLERVLMGSPVFNRTASWSGQVFLAMLIWPRYVAPFRWGLTRYDMPIQGVDGAFDGYRILQLTDLHAGKTKLSYLERVVERCLEEKPDLITITGDLIDYEPQALAPITGLLKKIVAGAGRDGVCAIFGNHDYNEYSWRHIGPRAAHRSINKRLVSIVQDAGVRLLRNQAMAIVRPARDGRGEAKLTIVGIDEMWTGLADGPKAFKGLTPQDAVICLQHNPDGVDFLKELPWKWMLCGHSHGAQMQFPLLGALYVPMVHREYLQGFFEFPPLAGQDRKRVMFVSRGLGYSHQVRLRCPPEASVFTVRCAG